MGVNAGGFRSFSQDDATQLKDAGLIAATAPTEVSSVAVVLDFGAVTSGPVATQIAYTPGTVLVNISAIESATADEHYTIVWQLSDNVAFGSGVTVLRSALVLGDGGTVVDADDQDDNYPTGLLYLDVDNEQAGVLFRFARLVTVITGTIATGINYEAWFNRNQ